MIVLGGLVERAGPGGAALGIAIGGVGVLLIAACYAEMAARLPAAGGELVYAYQLGGPAAAYVTGWTLALVYVSTCAFEAISIGQLAALLFPGLEGEPLYTLLGFEVRSGALLLGAGVTCALWALNARGARGSALVQQGVTTLRLLFIAGFLLVALAYAEPANLRPLVAGEGVAGHATAILSALAAAPFLISGFSVVAATAEEAAPRAALGRALLWAVGLSIAFYIVLILAISALVPQPRLAALELPAAQAFEIAMGTPVVAKLVLVTALLGNLTAWNGLLVAGSRVLFALGRAGLSPAPLARVSARHTPVTAIALVSLLSLAALPLGRGFILPLVNITSAAFGVTYIVTCLALRHERRTGGPGPAFVAPGGDLTVTLAIGAAVLITGVALVQPWFATPAGWPTEWVVIGGWVAMTSAIWFATRAAIGRVSEPARAELLRGQMA